MKKLLFLVMAAVIVSFSACKKDETKLPPTISGDAQHDITINESMDLSFNYSAEAGFNAANVTATNGTATITTNGISGSISGTITVSYTAGSTAGAGSVVLTVTDNDSQTSSATTVMNVVAKQTTFYVSANITENTTWETGNIYILQTRVSVESGSTLNIQKGVIVKGEAGTGPNATALLIARGGKIMAEGTADQPIIFTSVADQIVPGEIVSPNLDPSLNGLWGGVILCGKAPISADGETQQIEGIPPSDPNGLYGGTEPADNSGVITYVSIRHGGANIGEGNEINGLTLGGVGSGTKIDFVEIVANQDDGIEWFGGKVNVTNAVIWNAGDDAVDTDQSWGGTLDNFVVINPGDECFELDGPEGTMEDRHTITNGTVLAQDADGLADLDDNSIVTMTNVYFNEIKDGQDYDLNPVGLTGSDWQATIPDGFAVTDFFKDGTDVYVTAVNDGANTVGANLSVFQGWSWAAVAGNLSK